MKHYQKILAGFVLAALVVVVNVGLYSAHLFESTQLELSKTLYKPREISDEIVIVGINNKTLSEPEEGGLGWISQWPRSYLSSSIENLEAAGAKVIMLDMVISSEQRGISADELYLNLLENGEKPLEFIESVATYLQSPHPGDLEFSEWLSQYDNLYLAKSTIGEAQLENNQIVYEAEHGPISIINDNTQTGYTHVLNADLDSKLDLINALPPVLNVNGSDEEHITLKLLRDFLNLQGSGHYTDQNETYQMTSDIEIPIEEGTMLINFAKEPYDWPVVSFVDVFYNQFPSSMVEGKIVLIGPYSNQLQDHFSTPLSEIDVPMQGIEIHANAIQTILDQEFLEYQDFGPFLALIGGIALLSVFSFLYLPVWAGLVVLLAQMALFPFYAQWRFEKGVIINLIWPVATMLSAYLLVLAYRNVTEFREKRKLKNAFSHYVSPELVKQIADSGDDLVLGGERRVMTTLFLDLENFTTLSESMEPHAVVKIINTYFDAFAKEIMAHGGTVDKFEGDAIMALFGAPIKSEDHALKACQTAMAIRSRIGQLNQETGQTLNVRIGIATGDCIVGNMGSEARFDYTAMGDTVNTASRLEGGNKFYGTRILVNAATMEGSHEKIFFRRIDRVRLKGKVEAIDIYEVMGAVEAVSEEGKLLVNEWHSALEYYRNQDWDGMEAKLRNILKKMPTDGPALAYLKRLESLRQNPPQGWDGTWTFSSK